MENQTKTSTIKKIATINTFVAVLSLVGLYGLCVASFIPTQTSAMQRIFKKNSVIEKKINPNEYQDALNNIYHAYQKAAPSSVANLGPEEIKSYIEAVQGIKSQVLGLQVPEKFMSLHLKLASSLGNVLEAIEQKSDEKLKGANEKIDSLAKENSWLQ